MTTPFRSLNHDILMADGCGYSALSDTSCPITDMLCIEHGDVLRASHTNSVDSGCHILRTASPRASGAYLAKIGLEKRMHEINWKSAQIASGVAHPRGVKVWGRVFPLGYGLGPEDLCKIKNPVVAYQQRLGGLLDGGSDAILFEFFTDVQDACDAIEALRNLHHCPAYVALSFPEAHWPDESTWCDIRQQLIEADAEAVGLSLSKDISSELPPHFKKNLSLLFAPAKTLELHRAWIHDSAIMFLGFNDVEEN